MAGKTLIYAGAEAQGLYRKEAGDTDWKELTDGLPDAPQARTIVANPRNQDEVFVGTQRGVYRSLDRGDHWDRMDLPEGRVVWSIRFHPHDPQVMYLGTESSEVFVSKDDGEGWRHLSTIFNPGAVEMPFATRILGIALESDDPNRMFAAMEVGGAARSDDGGLTWQIVNREFEGDVDLSDHHGVAVGSPSSDAVFVSNRVGVWRSRDRGDSWQNMHFEKVSPIRYSRGVQVAPDDPNTLYACVGGDFGSAESGVLRTTDLGESWHRFDHGVKPGSTTFGVAINTQSPEQVYFCTRRGEVFGTRDDGASWEEHRLPESAGDVISVACASA